MAERLGAMGGIRDMHLGDLDAVLCLNNANQPAVSGLDRRELEADIAVAAHALAVGSDDLLGFCVTFPSGLDVDLGTNYKWFSDRYDDFLYLDRVVIDAAHRSRGLGEALYREVEHRMRSEGRTSRFTCEVNLQPRNEGSLRFHARLGFEQVGEQQAKPGIIVAMLAKTVS